jgi:hypothetical protein
MSGIGYTLKPLRCIPHVLTFELKHICLTMCLQLFPILRAYPDDNWQHLVTGNENQFYCEYVRDRIRTTGDENTHEVENRTIASRKSMLAILWNPDESYCVTMLSPRASFNTAWFTNGNSVRLLEKFIPAGWNAGRGKLVVHIENAFPAI